MLSDESKSWWYSIIGVSAIIDYDLMREASLIYAGGFLQCGLCLCQFTSVIWIGISGRQHHLMTICSIGFCRCTFSFYLFIFWWMEGEGRRGGEGKISNILLTFNGKNSDFKMFICSRLNP